MAFVKDLNRDEIRSGHFVSSERKKLWNRQLEIWQTVDGICRKHGINYWAHFGTLLGAARHKGFIPWDDDLDFSMMRPDYNRFCAIIEDELIRGGGLLEVRENSIFAIKIAHSQTVSLALEDLVYKQGSKGLKIDFTAMDAAPDGTVDAWLAACVFAEFFTTIRDYPAMQRLWQNGGRTISDAAEIEELHSLPAQEAQRDFFNRRAEELFDKSSVAGWWFRSFLKFMLKQETSAPQSKAWYRETVYLPFESVELPAPAAYDEVLTSLYGDWHRLIYEDRHHLGLAYSADVPYREFLARADLKFILPQKNKS